MSPPRRRGSGPGAPRGPRRAGPRSDAGRSRSSSRRQVRPGVPRGQRGLGGEQVEGRQAVRELLVAGRRRVREVWLADDVDGAPILGDILELAAEARTTVRRVPGRRLRDEATSQAPQGVLARADPLPEADLDSLLCPGRSGEPPFVACLDAITDPQNLGALLRSAECAGVSGVVLPRHRAAHVTPTVAKAAAGAVEHLPLAVVPGMPAALARAREQGVWVVGLDVAGDTSLFDLSLAREPVALVLGAEGRGLGRLVRDRCDVLAAIPLRGVLSSLNVASAGALAFFEITRRRLR